MGGYAFVLELGEIFGPDIGGREHHVDIVGGEGGCAFGPVVDDFEGDFQAFAAVDGFGGGADCDGCGGIRPISALNCFTSSLALSFSASSSILNFCWSTLPNAMSMRASLTAVISSTLRTMSSCVWLMPPTSNCSMASATFFCHCARR